MCLSLSSLLYLPFYNPFDVSYLQTLWRSVDEVWINQNLISLFLYFSSFLFCASLCTLSDACAVFCAFLSLTVAAWGRLLAETGPATLFSFLFVSLSVLLILCHSSFCVSVRRANFFNWVLYNYCTRRSTCLPTRMTDWAPLRPADWDRITESWICEDHVAAWRRMIWTVFRVSGTEKPN